MDSSFKKERALLRRRLQAQREQLTKTTEVKGVRSRTPSTIPLFEPGNAFPRSIAMRLLTSRQNRQNFVLLAVVELLPLLVRYLLRNALEEQQNRQRELNI